MELKVENLTKVDRKITVLANREDLSEQFEKAYKHYRSRVNLPGFRKGNIPVAVIRQRFGKEIEFEEISKYLNTVFEKEIAPEHNPVGEAQITDLEWENDKLEAVFKIGVEPDFALANLKKITVNKLVHDVPNSEVDKEITRALERAGTTEEVEQKITKDHVVVVDAQSLDDKKKPIEGQLDENQRIDLSQESAEEFLKALKGKRKGDVVDMTVGKGKEKDRFRVTVKQILAKKPAEANETFIESQSNGEAKTMDELRSYLKSRMQEYYDQTATQVFQQDAIDALIGAHKFDIPEVFLDQILKSFVEEYKQKQGKNLPKSFNEEAYKLSVREQADRESRWFFIYRKLENVFTDLEITAEDIDGMIAKIAGQYGIAPEQMKSYYAQNLSQLESLRNTIRSEKVFDKLESAVSIKELSKEAFNKIKEKEAKKRG